MLVPRRLRLPVRERILADGSIHEPLDEEDVIAAAATFREQDVEAIGICFLWSFRNPVHEERAAEILREELPDVTDHALGRAPATARRVRPGQHGRGQLPTCNLASPVTSKKSRRWSSGMAIGAPCATYSRTAGSPAGQISSAAPPPRSTPDRPRPPLPALSSPATPTERESSPSTWAGPVPTCRSSTKAPPTWSRTRPSVAIRSACRWSTWSASAPAAARSPRSTTTASCGSDRRAPRRCRDRLATSAAARSRR